MNEITFQNFPQAVTHLLNKVDNIERLLSSQNNSSDSIDHPLTIEEACEYLKLKKGTIYQKVREKTIPHSKKGSRLYFSKQELVNWIKEGRKKTINEIKDEASTYIKKKKK